MDNIKKAAIIILTFNNLNYNKDCIESIRKYTEKGTYEIIVVDNNSTDGTREWLQTQSDLKLALNDYNAGFPKGCNIGIQLAEKTSDILLLNNDTVVTPRWLENLQICLYSDEKIGATGAVCNQNENLQGSPVSYDNLDEMVQIADKNNVSDCSKWEEKVFLIGFCLLIKRDVLDVIGQLDEIYSPGYVEDNDLCLSIIEAGYRLMLCHDCFIHHYLGSAFRKDLSKFYPVLFANREKFKSKWGFQTFIFDSIRFNLLKLIDESNKNKALNVLEIGCGLGVTLLKIKHNYPNAQLYGIEDNKNIAKLTKNIANISTKKVGEFPLEFPEGHFDYILIGNYLENVENPNHFLLGLKKYLKKDGYLIGAIQNIMHYSVVKDLLNGNWRYSKEEILKKSNKTFFTGSDIIRLFTDCGYTNPYIFHWYSVPTDEEEKLIEKLCDIGGKDRDFFYRTYEYVVKFQNI